ncbi:MAG: hypothetical protein Q9216_002870 [Gyalolechia sp. 2 TL-2023]
MEADFLHSTILSGDPPLSDYATNGYYSKVAIVQPTGEVVFEQTFKALVDACLRKQKLTLQAIDKMKTALEATIFHYCPNRQRIHVLAVNAKQEAELIRQHDDAISFHRIGYWSITI